MDSVKSHYYDHYINIGILGPVSSGKSTILCGLCGNNYTEINKRTCTMNIQVYMTMKESTLGSADIFKINENMNRVVLDLQKEKKYTNEFHKEITHYIKKIPGVINTLDNVGYKIYDTFGLNNENDYVDEINFNAIIKLIEKLNIIMLVFDSNDTITSNNGILNFVMNEIKKYNDKELIIILNKCDKIDYDENNSPLYETDHKYILDAIDTCAMNNKITNYKCIPICGTHIYVCRLLENNLHDNISDTLLDNFIDIEMGRSGHVYRTREEKIAKLNELSNQGDDVMRRNGYITLINNIDMICNRALFNMLCYNEWNSSGIMDDISFSEKYVSKFKLFKYSVMQIKNMCNFEGPFPDYIINFIDKVFNTLTTVSHIEIFNKYKFIKKPIENVSEIINVFQNKLIKTQVSSATITNYISDIRGIRDMYEVMFETNKRKMCSMLNEPIDKHITYTNELIYAVMKYKLSIIYDYDTAAYLFANNKMDNIDDLDIGVNNYYNSKRLKNDMSNTLSRDIENTLTLYKNNCTLEKVMDIYLMIMKILISKKNTKTVMYLKYWLLSHCKNDFNEYQNHIYSDLYTYVERELSKYEIENLEDLTFIEKKQFNEILNVVLVKITDNFFGSSMQIIDSHRSNDSTPDLEDEISLTIPEADVRYCDF